MDKKENRHKAVRRCTAQERQLIRHNKGADANAATAVAIELPGSGLELLFMPAPQGGSVPVIAASAPLPQLLPVFEGGVPLMDANGQPVFRGQLRKGLHGVVLVILADQSVLSPEGLQEIARVEQADEAAKAVPFPTLRPAPPQGES